MAGALDSILNFLIPLGIFFFFGVKIYEGLQIPIDRFVGWINSQMNQEDEEDPFAEHEIIFRP